MSGLQEAFYILGIIFMTLFFIIIIALTAAVFVIRSKINKIHDNIESKLNVAATVAEKGGELAAAAVNAVSSKAKKTVKKKR